MSQCMSSMFQGGHQALCEPLQLLKNEHGPLNEQKLELYKTAEQITNSENLSKALLDLRNQVELFQHHLHVHSEKEENALFTMMAIYIGRESGPIAVMEYEHEQAEKNIDLFLEKTNNLSEEIGENEAKELADYIINAYNILTEHFGKEENVLYPMAERMLSEEEKEELLEAVK